MYAEDEYSKFTKRLSKLINTQWTKVTKSTSSSLKSEKNIDQQLEEEYETLLREIDYLTSEKSCYLSFLNNNFNKGKSSEDLSNILKKHSSEVLKNYTKENDKNIKTGNLTDRNDLINFVTEIVVSRNKCNNKLCSCKPRKVSKEVLTDSTSPRENGKETQTTHSNDNSKEKATGVKPIINQKANQTKLNVEEKATAAVQTDDWNHDPLCKCGCCPKTKFETDTKSVVTDKKPVQNATTSDRKITSTKNVFANCVGETQEVLVNTSTKRLCVPNNFETRLRNDNNTKFSACSEKKDCSCDAYDVKEALKRGLILASSDICIQRKTVQITDDSKTKEESKENKELNVTNSSDGNETSETSSSSDNKKKKKEKKEKKKENKKEKKSKKNKKSEESSSSSPREESKKKKKEKPTTCFGSKKKKSKCDEYCLGISEEHRSMQTTPITTQDKNEEALFQNKNGCKCACTSTDSEVGTQVSTPSSSDNLRKSKQDKETYSKVNKKKEAVSKEFNGDVRVTTSRDSKIRFGGDQDNYVKSNQERDNREKGSKEKTNDATVCTRCGRLKRDCNSGCRNTIIIPYASSSNRGIPASEVESLKMLIKMQSKDTNRQFDNIISELNHQKCEVRRLNDMYQKMLGSFYDLQKSTNSSRSESKKASDLSHDCRCSYLWNGKKSDTAKECGCSGSNDCKMIKKLDTPTKRSNDTSNNSNNSALRRFGPPNTAVAINRCDICNVEIAGNSIRACIPSRGTDYKDGDKQRKDVLNLSKKKSKMNGIPARKENAPASYGDIGDPVLSHTDSLSIIYKNNKEKNKDNENIEKRGGDENVLDEKREFMNSHKEHHSPRQQDIRDVDTDTTEGSEPGRKTRGIYSSRVLIWLKKSWISIKHMTEECREKDRQKREDHKIKCMLNFCHGKAKRAASGMWKAAKRLKKVI